MGSIDIARTAGASDAGSPDARTHLPSRGLLSFRVASPYPLL